MRTQYTETVSDGTRLTVEADWSDAASPLTYGLDGAEPTERTPFQVADATHSRGRAIEIVDQWLDAAVECRA